MGERTARDDEKIRVPDEYRSIKNVGTLLWKKLSGLTVPNCPECTSREKKKIQAKYEADTPEEERGRDDLYKLFDEIEIPMKMDSATKHSFVKDVGYTLQENKYQISDTN